METNAKSFNLKSEQYANARPRYPVDFYKHLINLLDTHYRLWDCACGNGQVAIDLVDYFDELYATDSSENQIKNAFKHHKIKYQVTQSEYTSFPDDYFDMICVAQALHWFNLKDFFKEAERVLKPNGVLAIFGYGYIKVGDEVDNILEKEMYAVIDEFWSDGNRMILSGFRGVTFPFTKVDIPTFSMNQNWSLSSLLAYLDTWSAVKRYNEHNNENITQTLKSHLQKIWDLDELKTVKMDLYTFIRRK